MTTRLHSIATDKRRAFAALPRGVCQRIHTAKRQAVTGGRGKGRLVHARVCGWMPRDIYYRNPTAKQLVKFSVTRARLNRNPPVLCFMWPTPTSPTRCRQFGDGWGRHGQKGDEKQHSWLCWLNGGGIMLNGGHLETKTTHEITITINT